MSFEAHDAEARFSFPAAALDGGGAPAVFLRRMAGALAYHEASHVLVARFFGLPVQAVTIIPSEHFAGRVLAPEANPNTLPEAQIEATERLCDQVRALLPEAGEDPADGAVWAVHAHYRVIELLAGREGEARATSAAVRLDNSTDIAQARLYAGTICQPALFWVACDEICTC